MRRGMTYPAKDRPSLVFDHLARLSDERGLFEHAEFDAPRREHGYCVDDVARALVVVSRQPDKNDALRRLNRLYLDFVLAALAADGASHNRMSVDGAWVDEPSVEDCWGRAVWGLGVAASDAPKAGMRARALAGFRIAAQQRSPHLHAMAFAALGAGRLVLASPDEAAARDLLRDCASVLSDPVGSSSWVWPEPRLRYANAAIAEALIVAGDALGDQVILRRGIQLLEFLLDVETANGHISVTPVAGRGPGERGPAFDQQPIEVAALAEACTAAYLATSDPRWPEAAGPGDRFHRRLQHLGSGRH